MNARRKKQTDQDNGANAMNMMTTILPAGDMPDWASLVGEYRQRRSDREPFADAFNAAERAYFENKSESNEAIKRTAEAAYTAASRKAMAAYERLAETPVSNLEQFLQKLEIIADEEDAFHECNAFIGWLITIAKNDAMSLSRSYGAMALAPVAALPVGA